MEPIKKKDPKYNLVPVNVQTFEAHEISKDVEETKAHARSLDNKYKSVKQKIV